MLVSEENKKFNPNKGLRNFNNWTIAIIETMHQLFKCLFLIEVNDYIRGSRTGMQKRGNEKSRSDTQLFNLLCISSNALRKQSSSEKGSLLTGE